MKGYICLVAFREKINNNNYEGSWSDNFILFYFSFFLDFRINKENIYFFPVVLLGFRTFTLGHGISQLPIQKDSILEGKMCIEQVIFWWKTQSCAEKGARDRMSMAGYSCISLHSIDNLNNWAFVVVRYDPMICCVLSPWLLARNSLKKLAPAYSIYSTQDWKDWHYSL